MSLNYSFAGKRVLVTGGASGIGKQLVKRLYYSGAIVFTVDKNKEFLDKLKSEFAKVTVALVNLTDWQATRKVIESFGPMDHLVNNAGFAVAAAILDVTEENMLSTFQVLTAAALNITQVVAKGMTKSGSGGTVVNVSSVGAHMAIPYCSPYSVAKSGIEALTKSLAVELGPQGVRINCVAPGVTDTPLIKIENGETNPAYVQMVEQKMVFKRLIEPDEIANVVLFLLSPLSSMVVGQTVVCDGGLVLA